MKKNRHRLLTIAMLLCSVTASAHDFEVDGIYYNITSATDLTVEVTYRGSRVTEYRDEYIGEVTIPSTVSYDGNTYSVTSIAAAFSTCSNLTSIIIPASVKNIGGSAFKYCSNLTSVTIPDGVTSIGSEAFLECTSLTSIILPESVTSIEFSAFSNTAWYDNQPNGVVYAGKVLYKYKGTMPGNTSVEVKDGTKGIAGNAFYGCNSNLTSITIPEGVTNIGGGAFSGCEGLTSIILPASVSCIGRNAFYETGLTSINIPASVTSIGTGAFQGCGNLTSVTISEGVMSIGELAFYSCNSLTSITIPESVTSIGYEAFAHSGLISITLPENVTSIGSRAFYSTIWDDQQPDGVTYLGNWLIDYKGTMPTDASIEVKEGTKGIADNAFESCTNLTSITIPESVTNVGEKAFYYCVNLASITCEADIPPTIGYSSPFEGVEKNIPVYVPAASISAYQTAEYWKEFTNIQAIAGDVLATSLTLDVTEASLAPNETLTLSATLHPEDVTNPVLTWTSSNEEVATVDEYGVVTAVALGTATITATANDGSGVSASCIVTVKESVNITVTMNQYGSGTYCSEYALDFSEVEGLKAYAATGYNTSTGVVTLTRVMTAKAGMGLFLKGEPGEYAVPTMEDSDDNSLNMLVGTLEKTDLDKTSADGLYRNYRYTTKTGVPTPMFYEIPDGYTLSANRAYLQIPLAWLPAETKSISLRFDDGGTTDMEAVESENQDTELIYDLMGCKVINPRKGMVYIVNGKKIVY